LAKKQPAKKSAKKPVTPSKRPKRISFEQWWERYQPRLKTDFSNDVTHISNDPRDIHNVAIWDYKTCWEKILAASGPNNEYLWSVIIGEDARRWYIVPGNHIVNREYVILTAKPHNFELDEVLY
jgi:hypothetical protein